MRAAASGVGISALSFGISLHSVSAGSGMFIFPSMDSTVNPQAILAAVSTIPAQVMTLLLS